MLLVPYKQKIRQGVTFDVLWFFCEIVKYIYQVLYSRHISLPIICCVYSVLDEFYDAC